MGEDNAADPTKVQMQWIHNVTNSSESLLKLQAMSPQPGSGSANHQSFIPFDNATPLNGFYRVPQATNQLLPNDVMYAKSLTEPSSGQHFTASSKLKNPKSSINNVTNDDLLTHEQYVKFKNLVIKGCETAEHLAYFHRNRPCFKKINCLCARLKQDVDRADSVLANINSQGVPWAVKDFIFVFTRIVSAWNIIKDYVYNSSEGMATIKSAISDRLVTSFLKWQEITTDFVEDLTKSFDGLQELTLSQTRTGECQKNADSNSCTNDLKISSSDVDSFESFKASMNKEIINERPGSDRSSDSSIGYINSSVKQLSIGADRKFDYIKTGIYKCTVARNPNQIGDINGLHRVTSIENVSKNQKTVLDGNQKSCIVSILSEMQNVTRNMASNEKFHLQLSPDSFSKKITDTFQDFLETNIKKKSLTNPKSDLLQKVCCIEESNFFFSSQFTKNYFPDFLKIVPDFVDLRSIIMKSEMEVYNNIYEVVHQIRQIFLSAKLYLQERSHELLQNCVTIFERDFENMLMREFAEYDFKNMTGYDF